MTHRPHPSWPTPILHPKTEPDAVQNLRHTLAVCADNEDNRMVLIATGNIYGDGIRTGLTMHDLRLILARLDAFDESLDAAYRRGYRAGEDRR